MALYELSTDAVKYGALAATEGRNEIDWSIRREDGVEDMLVMHWRESGGPRALHARGASSVRVQYAKMHVPEVGVGSRETDTDKKQRINDYFFLGAHSLPPASANQLFPEVHSSAENPASCLDRARSSRERAGLQNSPAP